MPAEEKADRKKKVGVLTFHDYDNYGAVLQSYALQKKLHEAGYDAEIIDYSCPYIHQSFSLSSLKKKGLLNYMYGAAGHICYIPRRGGFNNFRKNIRYSQKVTESELAGLSRNYYAVISGSDQLWDCTLTDYDRRYFLDFVAPPVKKISYAVSMGEHFPPEEYVDTIRQDLMTFDTILMRESYGADFVASLTGDKPAITCDPTLLLDGDEWGKIAGRGPEKGKYILVYQLGISKSFVRFVDEMSKASGLKIRYVPFPLVGLVKSRNYIAAGPEEWLQLIRDSEYVVSDSFHGIVFALLFKKNFFTQVDGLHMNRRLQELLGMVGMTDRIIRGEFSGSYLQMSSDYTHALKVISEFRKTSMEKLMEALK